MVLAGKTDTNNNSLLNNLSPDRTPTPHNQRPDGQACEKSVGPKRLEPKWLRIYIYIYIYIYIRRPLQSVERVRLQPSKSTMPFNIQGPAAQQQDSSPSRTGRPMPPAAQPRMTHACSSPGCMVQNLINYSSIGATARCKPGPQPARA